MVEIFIFENHTFQKINLFNYTMDVVNYMRSLRQIVNKLTNKQLFIELIDEDVEIYAVDASLLEICHPIHKSYQDPTSFSINYSRSNYSPKKSEKRSDRRKISSKKIKRISGKRSPRRRNKRN